MFQKNINRSTNQRRSLITRPTVSKRSLFPGKTITSFALPNGVSINPGNTYSITSTSGSRSYTRFGIHLFSDAEITVVFEWSNRLTGNSWVQEGEYVVQPHMDPVGRLIEHPVLGEYVRITATNTDVVPLTVFRGSVYGNRQ